MTHDSLVSSKKRHNNSRDLYIHSNDAEQKEIPTCLLYFDLIPENAIDNIVNWLSGSSRARNWISCITLEKISGLYNVKGELGALLQDRFTSLYFHDEEATGSQREYLFKISLNVPIGESFHTLIVDNSGSSLEVVRNQAHFISARFSKIRSLIFYRGSTYEERVWIENLGENLTSLDCNYDHRSIAIHCTNLKHLYLRGMILGGYSTMKFWETVGEHLEMLSVYAPVETMKHIEAIEKYCRKIKQLELHAYCDAVSDAISKCIASYGDAQRIGG